MDRREVADGQMGALFSPSLCGQESEKSACGKVRGELCEVEVCESVCLCLWWMTGRREAAGPVFSVRAFQARAKNRTPMYLDERQVYFKDFFCGLAAAGLEKGGWAMADG